MVIGGYKDAMVEKSRLSKLLSFVPNQRLPYKLVDTLDGSTINKNRRKCVLLVLLKFMDDSDIRGIMPQIKDDIKGLY